MRFRLVTGFKTVNQLFDGWHKPVGIKRIFGKIEAVVAREHQVVFDITVVGNVLQGLLNTKASGVGLAAGGILFIGGPV